MSTSQMKLVPACHYAAFVAESVCGTRFTPNLRQTISLNVNVKYDTGTLTGSQAIRLMSLTQEGVSKFWSRCIDLNGDTYTVNVNVSEDENGMPVRLKIATWKDYARSFNTNGASFPFSIPGASIY